MYRCITLSRWHQWRHFIFASTTSFTSITFCSPFLSDSWSWSSFSNLTISSCVYCMFVLSKVKQRLSSVGFVRPPSWPVTPRAWFVANTFSPLTHFFLVLTCTYNNDRLKGMMHPFQFSFFHIFYDFLIPSLHDVFLVLQFFDVSFIFIVNKFR